MDYFLERIITYFQLPLQEPVLLFSLLLFIILLSPIILRKIRLPAIIGLIISGAIIGPHGLGLIGPNTLADEGSIKSIRFINIELLGIKRFKTKPATNAPIMCSKPAT